MDIIPIIPDNEYTKYLLVCIGVINALSAYIFTNFKKSVEARLKKLEKRAEEDHDTITKISAEHGANHRDRGRDGV